jgi:hypothetical protein
MNPIREGVCRNDHIKTGLGTEQVSPAFMVQVRESIKRLAHVLIHQTIAREDVLSQDLIIRVGEMHVKSASFQSKNVGCLILGVTQSDPSNRILL